MADVCGPTAGPTDAKLAVVGEAPYPGETEPFRSKAGEYFRGLLDSVGVPQAKVLFTNVVTTTFDRDTFRGPNAGEIASSTPALLERIANARFVVLAGATALSVFYPGFRIGQMRGRPFCRKEFDDSQIYVPTFHPAGALRMPSSIPAVRQDLELMLRIGRKPEDWDSEIPETCVVCGEPGHYPDTQLVSRCPEHRG